MLCVFDLSRPIDEEDEAVLARVRESGKLAVAVLNKSDARQQMPLELPQGLFAAQYEICAVDGSGVDVLRTGLERLYLREGFLADAGVISNARQYAAVQAAASAADRAVVALASGEPQDIACMDLEQALGALCEVDARGVSTEITDTIFKRFCVGK